MWQIDNQNELRIEAVKFGYEIEDHILHLLFIAYMHVRGPTNEMNFEKVMLQ